MDTLKFDEIVNEIEKEIKDFKSNLQKELRYLPLKANYNKQLGIYEKFKNPYLEEARQEAETAQELLKKIKKDNNITYSVKRHGDPRDLEMDYTYYKGNTIIAEYEYSHCPHYYLHYPKSSEVVSYNNENIEQKFSNLEDFYKSNKHIKNYLKLLAKFQNMKKTNENEKEANKLSKKIKHLENKNKYVIGYNDLLIAKQFYNTDRANAKYEAIWRYDTFETKNISTKIELEKKCNDLKTRLDKLMDKIYTEVNNFSKLKSFEVCDKFNLSKEEFSNFTKLVFNKSGYLSNTHYEDFISFKIAKFLNQDFDDLNFEEKVKEYSRASNISKFIDKLTKDNKHSFENSEVTSEEVMKALLNKDYFDIHLSIQEKLEILNKVTAFKIDFNDEQEKKLTDKKHSSVSNEKSENI